MSVEDGVRQQIIDMYKAGRKTRDITQETGASRSTIYFILDAEGITPHRRPGPQARELRPEDIRRIDALEREVRHLRRALAQIHRATTPE